MTSIDRIRLLRGDYEPAFGHGQVPDATSLPDELRGIVDEPFLDREALGSDDTRPKWPGGKGFAVCLSHDVDQVSRNNSGRLFNRLFRDIPLSTGDRLVSRSKLFRRNAANFVRSLSPGPDPYERFEDWLEIEDRYGTRSTFFFAPDAIGRIHETDCPYRCSDLVDFEGRRIEIAELMSILQTKGFEVGLHPSWSSTQDAEEMTRQKASLDRYLESPMLSVRQHFLRFDPRVSPGVQAQAGFRYDSSIGFNDRVGFRRGTSYPFRLFDHTTQKRSELLEIPLAVQDGAMLLDEKGLRLGVEEALSLIRRTALAVQTVGGVLTLSWHPHLISEERYWDVYSATLALLKEMDPWFGTLGQIGEWWNSNREVELG